MPILNYTTSIKAEKSVMEIQKILSGSGAKQIGIDYDDDGDPVSVSFLISIDGTIVHYRLPSDWEGVQAALIADRVQTRYRSGEHALKVSWRIVKDWLEAQMAIIQSGQAKVQQVMLPYAVANDGRTLFEHFEDRPSRLLGSHTDTE